MRDMRDNDLRYFPDDDDDRMRDYRRAKDSYEFSLEPRHLALIVMVAIICGALIFAAGYMTGRSTATKGGGLIAKEGGEEKVFPLSEGDKEGTEGDTADEGKEPKVNFYDTLENGGITEEKLGEGENTGDKTGDVTPPKGETPGSKDEVAKTETGDDNKLYYIRVFATKDKTKADKLLKSLKADGYPAYIKEVDGGTMSIRIKWYNTKEEALKVMGDLMIDKNYKDYKPEIGTGWK
ncbi:MAG: SPOR domain-containing protein [Deltaproteobacteria bacterium]|uniref:SPOR domain-containing protein n=1 Tax=Candidatus Zymogenus saltonus TaxID=2844893 RepID=A0A9D8KJV6_9DELT|nr:SPOR domain-containing protein [Candidatus Zymogenus saltonus]